MAKNNSTENAEVDQPSPEEQQSPEEPIEQQQGDNEAEMQQADDEVELQEGEPEPLPEPAPIPEPDETTYKLPPTLADAGGVGVVGLVSGLYTVSSGSYLISPGQVQVLTAEDAQTLVDQGVAVMLDTYKTA